MGEGGEDRKRVQDQARQARRRLVARYNDILAIHYACQDFNDAPKYSAVSCIALKDVSTDHVTLFSRLEYEKEAEMLGAFFDYMNRHRDRVFVHWNMGHDRYGFRALEKRFQELTGQAAFEINRSQTVDLDTVIGDLYGPNYIQHRKLWNLALLNKYSTLNWKDGKEEAQLFREGRFRDINASTECKVGVIVAIMKDLISDRLLLPNKPLRRLLRTVEENPIYRWLVVASVVLGLLVLLGQPGRRTLTNGRPQRMGHGGPAAKSVVIQMRPHARRAGRSGVISLSRAAGNRRVSGR